MPSPACAAVMEQVPAETNDTVVPDTVHTDVVVEVKATVRPEVAVAESETVPPDE